MAKGIVYPVGQSDFKNVRADKALYVEKKRPNLPNGYRRTLLLPKPPAAIRQEPAGRHAEGVLRGAAGALREDGHGAAEGGIQCVALCCT